MYTFFDDLSSMFFFKSFSLIYQLIIALIVSASGSFIRVQWANTAMTAYNVAINVFFLHDVTGYIFAY